MPAFLCECMFGLCHAWPGVVFYWISVGLRFAQFSHSQEELVLLKETEAHLYQGFHLSQSTYGRGRMARITDGVKQFRPQGQCPNKKTEWGLKEIFILLLIDSL